MVSPGAACVWGMVLCGTLLISCCWGALMLLPGAWYAPRGSMLFRYCRAPGCVRAWQAARPVQGPAARSSCQKLCASAGGNLELAGLLAYRAGPTQAVDGCAAQGAVSRERGRWAQSQRAWLPGAQESEQGVSARL